MRAALARVVAPVRWLVVLEIGIWRSLFLWVTRRVPGADPGVLSFAYSRDVAPLIGAFILVSAIEVPVAHLLLPWETVRLVFLVSGIWGLLWMIGYLASLKVFRHLIDDDGLRARYGTTVDIRIPWDAVASVTSRRGSAPTSKTVAVTRGDDGAVVDVAVLKQTRVDVTLHGPTPIALPGGTESVTAVRLYADDPRAFVAAARERLAERASRSSAAA